MNAKDREWRFYQLKRMHCMVCPGCGPTEIHHQNLGGRAGNKRLGDEYTIPLGAWAHRGVTLPGYTVAQMEDEFGPSLARSSKRFRERYGTDEMLLAVLNVRLEQLQKLRVA